MSTYEERAATHQQAVWRDAVKDQHTFDFSDDLERMAIVHGRMDLVLIVSHLSSLNDQIATIRRLLWVVAVVGVFAILSRL